MLAACRESMETKVSDVQSRATQDKHPPTCDCLVHVRTIVLTSARLCRLILLQCYWKRTATLIADDPVEFSSYRCERVRADHSYPGNSRRIMHSERCISLEPIPQAFGSHQRSRSGPEIRSTLSRVGHDMAASTVIWLRGSTVSARKLHSRRQPAQCASCRSMTCTASAYLEHVATSGPNERFERG